MKRWSNRRGQIWVETVIYTLIGLAVIGLVLAGALPKIQEKKDSVSIERSIEAMGNIDSKIYGVLSADGSRRVVNLDIKSGALTIDAEQDSIYWVLDSSFPYSEINEIVPFGKMTILTTEKGDYEVTIKLEYDEFNLRYDGTDDKKTLIVSPTPYVLAIENSGRDANGKILIELKES